MPRTAQLRALLVSLVLGCSALVPAAAQTLEANRIAHDIEADGFILRFLEDPEIGFIDTLQILRGDALLYEGFFEAFVYMIEEPPGSEFSVLPLGLDVDVTGDGRPDFVLQSYSGGAHCCFYTSVFERTPSLYLVAEFDGAHAPVELANLDADPAYEVRLYDWTFAYWKTSFADSPAPEVVLDWQDGVYAGSVALMRKPPPSRGELATAVTAARAAIAQSEKASPLLWGPMLDYIYGGQSAAAFRLLDEAWPPEVPGRDAFLLQFGAQLSFSPYWETLAQLNGWDADF